MRRTGLITTMVVALSAFTMQPALAWHQWAGGRESSVGSYSAVGETRVNGTANLSGTSNCTTPYVNSPVYKTMWAYIPDANNFVEAGTGFGCQEFRYYYIFYRSGGVDHYGPIIALLSSDTGAHDIGLVQNGTYWDRRLDGFNTHIENFGTVPNAANVSSLLESYDFYGIVPTDGYTELKYETNGSAWIYWSGRDANIGPSNPLCAGWDSDHQLHARENGASC